MHPDRRREGRAIRKQRRLEREAVATVHALDWTAISTAFVQFGESMMRTIDEVARFTEAILLETWSGWQSIIRRWEWEAQERRRKEFEWRLAHRALTTGGSQ